MCTCEPVSLAMARRKGIRAISSGYTGTHSHLWGVTNVLSANYRLKSDKRKIRGKKDSCTVLDHKGGYRGKKVRAKRTEKWNGEEVWVRFKSSNLFFFLHPKKKKKKFYSLLHFFHPLTVCRSYRLVVWPRFLDKSCLIPESICFNAEFTGSVRGGVIRAVQALNISHIFSYSVSMVRQDHRDIKYNICFSSRNTTPILYLCLYLGHCVYSLWCMSELLQ